MEIINVTDEIIEINVTEAVVNVVTQNGAYPLPSNVFSVFGRVGNVVGQAGDYTTSIVAEGTNLYYTQARFNTAFGNKTTTDLTEGTNLYYTDARSRAAISENITGLEYSSASGIFSLANGYLIPTQAMLDAKVPYTGATGNVTLGEHQLSAGQVTFDQTPTGTAGVGVLRWNDTDGTLDLGLKGGNVTLQIGQEQVKRVVNGTGINLTEAAYQVVRVSGAQGQRLQVVLAQANNDQNSATTLGIVTENINNNQEGFITTSGEVRNINTTGSLQGETWADGDVLYLSPSVAGRITNIKPVAPNHMVIVGYVEYAHQNNGKIFVKVDNGYELDELHNVKITDPLNNQALIFDSTDSVWKNESIASAIGYTPANAATSISTTAPLTGGGDLSANRTLAITQSSASADGYLSSTDWSTFNNKQPLIAAGTTAQYYRGDKTFQTLDTLAVPENTNLYYTQARFDTAFGNKSTTNLAEGTNLYYTDARARAAITGTAPIDVSGGVVSISQASGSSNGYLSSTDWNTFNNKQAALNGTGFVKISGTTISYDANTYLTTISGIAAGGELSGTYPNPTLVNSAVTGKVLTGLNLTGGGTIADTDSILGAFGKVQNQISALVGGVMYEGTWNASTNTPTIVSSVGSKGDYYIVATAGSTNINGITSWNIGDWIIFNGTAWDKVDNTDAVSSVNGYTGAVSLVTSDVPESGSLYFTNARAIGSTLTGYTSGAGVVAATDTILQAIQKLNGNVSGLVTGVSSVFGRTGAVVAANGDYNTSQVTENTNLYYTEARVSANTDVAANTAARHAAVTIGTANGLSLSTQALSLAAASTSTTGALTSTDWNTFNNKQAALNGTGFVKISGTTISYDNSTYLTTSSASATYLPLTGGTLTGALNGTSATFLGKLTIGNSSLAEGEIGIFETGGNYNFTTFKNGLVRTIIGSQSSTSQGFLGTASNHDLLLKTNDTTRLTIASSGAATFSSSIDVATTARFHSSSNWMQFQQNVLTSQNNDGAHIRSVVSADSAPTYSWTGDQDTGMYTPAANTIAFSTGATERMRITSGGNVGIGSSDAGALLVLRSTQANSSNYPWLTFRNGANGYGTWGFFKSGSNNLSLGYSTDTDTPMNNATAITFQYGGNVGIGTSSPVGRLMVYGSSAGNIFTSLVSSQGGSTQVGINFAPSMTDSEFASNQAQASIYATDSNYGANIIFANKTTGAVGNSLTERMRITSGGNVEVKSAGELRTYRSDNARYGTFYTDNSAVNIATSVDPLNLSSPERIALNTAGTERMRITSAGNVLVGYNQTTTTTIGRTFATSHASGNRGATLFYGLTDGGNGGMLVYNVASSVGGHNSQYITFETHEGGVSSGERMRISSAGYISLNNIVYGNTVNTSPRTLYIESGTGSLGGISSIRASKKNIQNFNSNWIYDLQPVQFNYRKKDKDGNFTDESYDELFYGLIAEDTAPIADFLVNYNDKEDGTKEMVGIEYMRLITPMLKAIQELEARIKQLENK